MITRKSTDVLADVLDVESALGRLGGDEDLFDEIVQIYLEDAPLALDRLGKAIAAGDADVVKRAAHSLKGLAGALNAHCVVSDALQLELMGSSKRLEGADDVFRHLADHVAALITALERFAEQAIDQPSNKLAANRKIR